MKSRFGTLTLIAAAAIVMAGCAETGKSIQSESSKTEQSTFSKIGEETRSVLDDTIENIFDKASDD